MPERPDAGARGAGDGPEKAGPHAPEPEEQVPGQEITFKDAANWAKAVARLSVGDLPPDAINRNVEGRRLSSPIQGFGKLWRRTYRVVISGDVPPREVIARWKSNFAEFWPRGSRFYGPLTELKPGDVAVLNLSTSTGMKLSTGVFVMYADDESFTFMTPQGHQFAGWITFSSFSDEGRTVAQVEALLRCSDPLFELGWPIMAVMEDRFWIRTLEKLAAFFGRPGAPVERESVCIDRRRQWSMAGNVWHNALVRSGLYYAGAPMRAAGKVVKRFERT